jgi:hypothetical protein
MCVKPLHSAVVVALGFFVVKGCPFGEETSTKFIPIGSDSIGGFFLEIPHDEKSGIPGLVHLKPGGNVCLKLFFRM